MFHEWLFSKICHFSAIKLGLKKLIYSVYWTILANFLGEK
jgi:hypothetical protein